MDIKSEIKTVIQKIKNGCHIVDILTSKFFKPEMRSVMIIIDKWTFNHAYVDERAVIELEALIAKL